jgi:hypothetical protein
MDHFELSECAPSSTPILNRLSSENCGENYQPMIMRDISWQSTMFDLLDDQTEQIVCCLRIISFRVIPWRETYGSCEASFSISEGYNGTK